MEAYDLQLLGLHFLSNLLHYECIGAFSQTIRWTGSFGIPYVYPVGRNNEEELRNLDNAKRKDKQYKNFSCKTAKRLKAT